jgi:hypothetical protein
VLTIFQQKKLKLYFMLGFPSCDVGHIAYEAPSLENAGIQILSFKFVSAVLYGCITWSLTLREEHRLRMFENRVLRRIFGPKRDELTGGWRKLHNEEIYNSYFLQV